MSQELNFNFFNILIISGTVQGLIFGLVVLLSKRYKSTPNKYLAQVVIYLSLSNLYYWMIDTKIADSFQHYQYYYIPWSLLVLPMYYFFVVTYLKYDLEKKILIYLKLPFIISFLIHAFLLIHTLLFTNHFVISNEIKYAFYNFEEYFSILFTIYLIYRVFVLIKSYENEYFSSSKVTIQTKWLKHLLYYGLLICLFWFVIISINHFTVVGVFKNNGKYFLWISMSILIYWLGYLGVYHSNVFSQRQQIRTDNARNFNPTSKIKPNLNTNRFEEIDNFIKKNKMYLNPTISLDVMADHFNLSKGYISQLVNEFANTNFSNYINHLRIKESKKMLLNEEYNNYTIVAIALEAGFNSKSTFYNAFKKDVGISPSEYKKRNMS